MRHSSYLTTSRHGIYYFRWPVPPALHPDGRRTDVKVSTRTRCPIRSALDDFAEDGDLVRCKPGDDLPGILELLERARSTGKLVALGLDPAGAQQLTDALDEAPGFRMVADPADVGWTGDVPCIGIGQGAMSLMPALRTLERKAEEGALRVSDARLMQWNLSNVRMVRRGSADAIDRPRNSAKIDLAAALLDAVSVLLAAPEKREFDPHAMIG